MRKENDPSPSSQSLHLRKHTHLNLISMAFLSIILLHFSMLSGKHSQHAIRLLINLNYSDFLEVFPTQTMGRDSEKLFVRRTQGIFVL